MFRAENLAVIDCQWRLLTIDVCQYTGVNIGGQRWHAINARRSTAEYVGLPLSGHSTVKAHKSAVESSRSVEVRSGLELRREIVA